MAESVATIIASRREKTLVLGLSHAKARDYSNKRHYSLGVPVVVLTALVGTSAFANLSDLGQNKIWVGVITGALSILATVLAALQTFLDYGGDAKAHAAAAKRFNALNRRIDRLALLKPELVNDEVTEVDSALDKIIEESPAVSEDVQRTAMEETAAERAQLRARAEAITQPSKPQSERGVEIRGRGPNMEPERTYRIETSIYKPPI